MNLVVERQRGTKWFRWLRLCCTAMEVRGLLELPVRNNRDDGNFLREKMMSNERRLVVLSMCCSRATAGDDDGIFLVVRRRLLSFSQKLFRDGGWIVSVLFSIEFGWRSTNLKRD